MSGDRADHRRRSRLLEAAGCGVLATLFCAWLARRNDFIGNIADGAVYLVVAEMFSPYRGGDRQLGSSLLGDFAFPPLYPLLLGLLGGGAEAPAASYVASAAMMGGAVAAVYAWLRTQRLGGFVAAAISALFLCAPASLLGALSIQSEPLFVALVFGGLAALAAANGDQRMVRLAAALFGASVLARTLGICAVAAFLATWLWRPALRRDWSLPLLALLPALAWLGMRHALGAQASYLDSIGAGSPAAVLSSLAQQFGINLAASWHGLLTTFDLQGNAHARAVTAGLLVCALLGFAPRVRRGEPDALYCVAYLAVILVWPYPNHMRRFLQVLLPLFLFYGWIGLHSVSRLSASPLMRRLAPTAGACALLLITLPSTYAIVGQIAAAQGTEVAALARMPQWYLYSTPAQAARTLTRVREVMDAMRAIDRTVPRDACVSSSLYPYVPLYGRRRGRALAGESQSEAALLADLAVCPYVFMISATHWPPSDYPPLYPYTRIKDRLEVIEVTLWERGATSGQVLTMLARVRGADGPPAGQQPP